MTSFSSLMGNQTLLPIIQADSPEQGVGNNDEFYSYQVTEMQSSRPGHEGLILTFAHLNNRK